MRRVSFKTIQQGQQLIIKDVARKFRSTSRFEEFIVHPPKPPVRKPVDRTLSLKTI